MRPAITGPGYRDRVYATYSRRSMAQGMSPLIFAYENVPQVTYPYVLL